MNTSSSSAGDEVNDNSVNLQNGGTVVQMGLSGTGRGGGGQDAYNQGGNSSASSVEYSYNVLDGGAIENAFAFGELATEEAFDFGQKNTETAFDFGEKALDAVRKNSADTMEFNGDVLNDVMRTSTSQQKQNDKQLQAIQDFALKLKAGDSALMKQVSIYLIIGVVILGLGVVIYKAKK